MSLLRTSGPIHRILLLGMASAIVLLGSSCERAASPSKSDPEPDRRASAEAVDESDLAAILKIDEPLIRIERVAAYLQRAETRQLDEIQHVFEHAVLDRGDLEYALMIEWWARFAPKEAYEYTVQGNLRGEHARLRSTAIRAWARHDPQGPIETGYLYDTQFLDGSLDGELLDALIVGWWESGKPGLLEYIGGLKLVSDKTRAARSYARCLILRDGARAALEAIPQLTEIPEGHRRLMLAGALNVIAHEDPKLAVEWIPIAEAQGIDTRTFAMRIVGGWAHHDPLAATEWASQLPPGDERDRALQRVAQDWQKKDPEAFLKWLDGQKVAGEFDVIRFFSVRTSVYNAPLKVDWPSLFPRAQMIENAPQREAAILWCLQVWHHVAAKDAAAWLEAHPDVLPADKRALATQLNPGDKQRIDRVIEDQKLKETTEPLVSID